MSDVLEAMTELFEANTPTDSYFVQQAIQGGDRSDILQALSEINQSESQFKDGVAALSAEPEETQGLVQGFEQEADAARAALEQRLQQEVAAETGMAVFEARDGLSYHGPIIQEDDRFQYQQVAPRTLIAHDADKEIRVNDQGFGLGLDRGEERQAGLEHGYSR
ncbi:MAG TPA: hypothetical protein PKZ35_13880 [Gammaproteobacteria bacterium]|nr:hypothetical protein [Gammaproteobacteria bacterium]